MSEVDARMGGRPGEKVGLRSVRNELMSAATKVVAGIENLDARRVAFHILEEHDRQVESIARFLDMREMLVRSVLDKPERDFFA